MSSKREIQPGLQFGHATDAGRSGKHNEDSHGIFAIIAAGSDSPSATLIVVADGIGGAVAGERASRLAVETIERAVAAQNRLEWPARLEAALQTANREIYAAGQLEGRAGMGTTAVVAAITGTRVWIAHVGDSRAYLVRNSIAHTLTVDHTRVQEGVDAGELTAAEAALHINRHVITRNLGVAGPIATDLLVAVPVGDQPGLPPPATRRMEATLELRPGDTLLLCTDGLHDLISDVDIQTTVANYRPEEAVRRLVDQANTAGGTDNITVVLALWPSTRSAAASNDRRGSRVSIALLSLALLGLLIGFAAIFVGAQWSTGTAVASVTPAATISETTPTAQPTASPSPLPTSTSSPAPTATPNTPTSTVLPATATPSATATPTAAPTATITPPPPTAITTKTPLGPPASTPGADVTLAPAVTPPPLAGETPAAQPPPGIVLPTPTAPSATPLPAPDSTPAPEDQPAPPAGTLQVTAAAIPALTIIGETPTWNRSSEICFRWQWAGALAPDQAFEIFVWRKILPTASGTTEPGYRASAINVVDLNKIIKPHDGGNYSTCFDPQHSSGFRGLPDGTYDWSVAIVVKLAEGDYKELKASAPGKLLVQTAQ
jgi:PPM family protein phosphatase